jgi:hypothetical protein
MKHTHAFRTRWIITTAILLCAVATGLSARPPSAVVDTGQLVCYGVNGEAIPAPPPGQPLHGQDAQYRGLPPTYHGNTNGTVTDLNTGLIWQKTPPKEPLTWQQAKEYADELVLAGVDDWRLPTMKELLSIVDFSGSIRTRTPYVDTQSFDYHYPDTSTGVRDIDAQYWSSNGYLGTVMRGQQGAFGFNFADGRIKCYPVSGGRRRGGKRNFVRCVRGRTDYGRNDFVDNGDGTVTDRATGLMWTKADSAQPKRWPDALAYAESLELAGHGDWRLPNAKELHSIVDYSKAPDARDPARRGPAIDPVFSLTDQKAWHWTSTTHGDHKETAIYIAFGRAMSAWEYDGKKMNAHGAGALRSDPKSGSPNDFPEGRGPQGDEIRVLNYVRCVRGAVAEPVGETPVPRQAAGRQGPPQQGWGAPPLGPPPSRQGQPAEMGPPPGQGGPGGALFVPRLDRDGDGRVSKAEFDGPAWDFPNLDRNGDGFLTEEEGPHMHGRHPPPRNDARGQQYIPPPGGGNSPQPNRPRRPGF